MSYQVLARKWRPKTFASLVGQEHVVRALTHALAQQRLHHAYLFTGTRGVGKTTLSRILAKSFNCTGPDGTGSITAEPCGLCRTCQEIDAGRCVDYIEMDAASNRGVDEMAQLLEQAVYAPSGARFKVYMIDEVHMLTSHAFNAMLKTLEEPPEYVKFILATTEPQKIPATVLSRCLQFSLKQMTPEQVAAHLADVLTQENIGYEESALRLLAHAASGSMRDALSLADQAIAYSGGVVAEASVRSMLGALDQTYLVRILEALADGDGAAMLAVAAEIAGRGLSYSQALADLSALLHRMALAQAVPETVQQWVDATAVAGLSERFTPEEVQLDYQIANHGRAELGLAPDPYAGFTMTLLRMLAFQPEARGPHGSPVPGGRPDARAGAREPLVNAKSAGPKAALDGLGSGRVPEIPVTERAPIPREARARGAQTHGGAGHDAGDWDFDGDWVNLVARLQLSGLARQLAAQAALIHHEPGRIRLRVPIKSLAETSAVERLRHALEARFSRTVRIDVEVGSAGAQTVAAIEADERAHRQAEAESSISSDPFVKALVHGFDATIVPGSIRPTSPAPNSVNNETSS